MLRLILVSVLIIFSIVEGAEEKAQFQGLLLEPPRKINSVTFVNKDGDTEEFPGSRKIYRVVFFGFTKCTMVCPRGMQKMAAVRKELASLANRVEYYFISVDPGRDTSAVVKTFIERFDPKIQGLTGDEKVALAVQKEFQILTRKFRGKTALTYNMQHSAYIYVLDESGRLKIVFPAKNTPSDIAVDINQLLKKD